jgi:hypothetical protein
MTAAAGHSTTASRHTHGEPMTTMLSNVLTELEEDLSRAHVELAEAQFRLTQKDTPGHRRAVTECLDRIDALLDMRLEVAPLHL